MEIAILYTMPPRALASATISFGLVSIPIKMYSPKNKVGISFRTLHAECGTRLRQQYICPKHNEVVAREDHAKGFEFAKDQYVVLDEEEIRGAAAESTKTIAIAEFIPLEKVEPVFFDKPYYLAPDKGGARAYALLSRALETAGLCGLARYAARGKQYLVMLRPTGDGGLVMQELLYAEEIRPFSEVPVEEPAEIQEAELALALQLIQQTKSDEFRPENYRDDVRIKLEEIIEAKVAGQEITLAPAAEPQAQIIDLMSALKASLGQEGEEAPSENATKKSAKKAGRVAKKKKKAK